MRLCRLMQSYVLQRLKPVLVLGGASKGRLQAHEILFAILNFARENILKLYSRPLYSYALCNYIKWL